MKDYERPVVQEWIWNPMTGRYDVRNYVDMSCHEAVTDDTASIDLSDLRCPDCNGTGEYVGLGIGKPEPCQTCNGKGVRA